MNFLTKFVNFDLLVTFVMW